MTVPQAESDLETRPGKLNASLLENLIDHCSEVNSIQDIATYAPKIAHLFDSQPEAYKLLNRYMPQILERRGSVEAAEATELTPFGIRRFYQRMERSRDRRKQYEIPNSIIFLKDALTYELNPTVSESDISPAHRIDENNRLRFVGSGKIVPQNGPDVDPEPDHGYEPRGSD